MTAESKSTRSGTESARNGHSLAADGGLRDRPMSKRGMASIEELRQRRAQDSALSAEGEPRPPEVAAPLPHPDASGTPSVSALAGRRTPHKITVPVELGELLASWPYSREDLLVRALDEFYFVAFDRKLLSPLFPRRPGRQRDRISISTTSETWARVVRVAQRNGWNASKTVSTLLWHLLTAAELSPVPTGRG